MQLSDLDFTKTYTYTDYLKWTFEERLELIKGKIFKMNPAPGSAHQIIFGVLFSSLHNHLKGKTCKVFSAPYDVRLKKRSADHAAITTVVQPDICVICDPGKIDSRGCLGAPEIVVEYCPRGTIKKSFKTSMKCTKKQACWNIESYTRKKRRF